ncbi:MULTISPECIES: hypothetical protein [Streptomyces]|uniref:Uncharacterized protein n=1 Tax=Streptomyces heliomycini TaxID=284032 RepID=A0ABV5LJ63_9ACTN|nr:hypothetical protein [Streptomyces sp. XY152]KOV21667.1 hypothetical protein ADK58_30770 [Streptomyces sp. XY152]
MDNAYERMGVPLLDHGHGTEPLLSQEPASAGETDFRPVIRFVFEDVEAGMLRDDVSESDQLHWLDHIARPP